MTPGAGRGGPPAPRRIAIVAGEPSGDRLAAGLMAALRAEAGEIDFVGVGGPAMAREGLASWFDFRDLAVMGFTELLPHLPRLLGHVSETAARVVAAAPDALVTVDSPGFNLRLARAVRRRRPELPVIHYVAPSVWAWAPGRARRMRGTVDHVLALLPFEPPHFAAHRVSCDFVGHPAAAQARAGEGEVAALRRRAGADTAPLLLVAPGSRRTELRHMLPVIAETLALLRRRVAGLRVVVPVAETVAAEVRAAAEGWFPPPLLLMPGEDEAMRRAAMAAADAALVTSGSIVLELAAQGTPMVSAYRTGALTAALVRRLARVDTANLVNLVAGRPVVPEFLQEHCVPGALAAVLERLLREPGAGSAQRTAFPGVLSALGRDDAAPPSVRAARSLLAALARAQPRCSTST